MSAFLFPGQGSQHVGMGGELFKQYPQIVESANEILGYDLATLCLEDPDNKISQTQFTQPVLYTVNALHYFKQIEDGSPLLEFLAGHSLGEYNALLAAGVFDFATGLKLVQKRGDLMSKAKGGGMAAVLGASAENIASLLHEKNFSSLDIANLNAPAQTVISGLKADIENAQACFEESGFRYVILNVSGAFHSRYMSEAKQEFSKFIEQFNFSNPKIPTLANVDAKPYRHDNVQHNLIEQLTSSVQWVDTIQFIASKGITDFIEVGPGKVLTGLNRRILRDINNTA